MTDISRLRSLSVGLHSADNLFKKTDVGNITYAILRTLDDAQSFSARSRVALDRPLRSLSGRRYAHVWGTQDVADLTLSTEFRGVNSNSGGAVADWEAKLELGSVLRSFFGAVAPATTGAATTVAGAGHTAASGILGVASETNYAAGQVIGFATDDEGLQVGRIASTGVGTITLEHPYLGTPTTGATVFRAAKYTVAQATTHHRHISFNLETENQRRRYFGCLPKTMTFQMASGQAIVCNTACSMTEYDDVAEANPAHSEPTSGSPIVVESAMLWLDGIELMARDLSIMVDNSAVVRKVDTSVNGILGGVASASGPKQFKVEFTAYIGNNSLNELQDSTGTIDVNAVAGDDVTAGVISTTRKLALQVGKSIGSCLYAYMAEATVTVTSTDVDGMSAMKFVCIGSGAVTGELAIL
jgi:hypothetical protein